MRDLLDRVWDMSRRLTLGEVLRTDNGLTLGPLTTATEGMEGWVALDEQGRPFARGESSFDLALWAAREGLHIVSQEVAA